MHVLRNTPVHQSGWKSLSQPVQPSGERPLLDSESYPLNWERSTYCQYVPSGTGTGHHCLGKMKPHNLVQGIIYLFMDT